jgi:hypothetical protein
MSLPNPEALQPLILSLLATSSDGTIPDTRKIEYNGVDLFTSDEQAVVRAALDSLASKEVSGSGFGSSDRTRRFLVLGHCLRLRIFPWAAHTLHTPSNHPYYLSSRGHILPQLFSLDNNLPGYHEKSLLSAQH